MQKFLIAMACLFTIAASAKVVNNPTVGMSKESFVTLEKVTISDTETVLQFYFKIRPGFRIYIPKGTYIQPVGGEKLTVTSAKDVLLEDYTTVPKSGDLRYSLTFPPIDPNTELLDFSEGSGSGAWFIYDIQLSEQKLKHKVPEEIYGKWRDATTGALEICLFDTLAIYNNTLWQYDQIKFKKGNGSIDLSSGGQDLTLKLELKDNNLWLATENTSTVELKRGRGMKPANDQALSLPILSADSAVYSGYLYKYNPRCGVKTMQLSYNNIISGDQEEYTIEIQENGFFSLKVPLTYPHKAYMRSSFYQTSVLYLEPGKELFHVISFEYPRSKTHEYMGELATINNELDKLKNLVSLNSRDVREGILDMTPKDYVAYLTTFWHEDVQKLDDKQEAGNISDKAFQLKKMDIDYMYAEEILSYSMYYRNAYRKRNNLGSRDKIDVDSMKPEYLPFITNAFVNNEMALTSNSYYIFINRLKYADFIERPVLRYTSYTGVKEYVKDHPQLDDNKKKVIAYLELQDSIFKLPEVVAFNKENVETISKFYKEHRAEISSLRDSLENDINFKDIMDYLIAKGKLSEEEKETAEMLAAYWNRDYHVKAQKMAKEVSHDSINAFVDELQPYRNRMMKFNRNQELNDALNKEFGIKQGIATDVMFTQDVCRDVTEKLNPIEEDELQQTLDHISNPFIQYYIESANDATLAKLAYLKTHRPDNKRAVPEVSNEQLLASILAPYKGKVVYVDFWATWCGPCRSGIQRIASLKDEMEGEDVVFLYLSGPSSPEGTWNNMIAEIKGEHFRLNDAQWRFLCDKYKITGIPRYMVVDKNGTIVNTDVGFMNNAGIKNLLEKTLQKDDISNN